MTDNWTSQFPALQGLESTQIATLVADSALLSVPDGTVVFGPGAVPDNMLLVLDGSVRVQQLSEAGREIVLYRVRAGESCVMTSSCLLAGDAYSAQGIAESAVDAVAIPYPTVDRLLGESSVFRAFVFSAYSGRLSALCRVVDDIAFQRVDVRLAAALLELARPGPVVRATHQQLSVELGTAREVVSRQLAEFQRREWVAQSRGEIALQDVDALKRLVSA